MDAESLPQPYHTQNVALAIALYICGVKFTTHEGVTFPGFNLYSRDFLKQKGCAGQSIDAAIQDLWKRGIAGMVVYCFERSDILKPVTEGWEAQATAIKAAESGNGGGTFDAPLEPDVIARICCQYARTRKEFMGDNKAGILPFWKRRDAAGNLFVPAVKALEGPSRTEHPSDHKTVTYGSMKLKSVKV